MLPIDIENLCRLSRGCYTYIIYIYRVLGSIYSQTLPLLFIEIYRVGDNRRTVNTSTSPHISDQVGDRKRARNGYVDLSLCYEFWFAKNMYRFDMNVILDLSTGTHHCPCFRLRNRTYQSWQSERHKDIIVGMHTWHQCSVTISEDILSTKYDLDLR